MSPFLSLGVSVSFLSYNIVSWLLISANKCFVKLFVQSFNHENAICLEGGVCIYSFFVDRTYLFLDINECVVGTHNCSKDAKCTNTKGLFTCACLPGYNGTGYICQGIELL